VLGLKCCQISKRRQNVQRRPHRLLDVWEGFHEQLKYFLHAFSLSSFIPFQAIISHYRRLSNAFAHPCRRRYKGGFESLQDVVSLSLSLFLSTLHLFPRHLWIGRGKEAGWRMFRLVSTHFNGASLFLLDSSCWEDFFTLFEAHDGEKTFSLLFLVHDFFFLFGEGPFGSPTKTPFSSILSLTIRPSEWLLLGGRRTSFAMGPLFSRRHFPTVRSWLLYTFLAALRACAFLFFPFPSTGGLEEKGLEMMVSSPFQAFSRPNT
jgi:hypothetical protein